MKRVGLVLAIMIVAVAIVSCAAPKEAVKGLGTGTTEIVEGAGRGVTEFGKGTLETVKGTAVATGEFVTGRGNEAAESGKDAMTAGGDGVNALIVKPIEGLGKGLTSLDKGVKKATDNEDIK